MGLHPRNPTEKGTGNQNQLRLAVHGEISGLAGTGWLGGERSRNGGLLPSTGGETMRNYAHSGAKRRVFRPFFAMQLERMYALNLLWRHADIAIAYKRRDICSAMGPSFSPTMTSPRKSLEIATDAKTAKTGFSSSCAMRSQNDNNWSDHPAILAASGSRVLPAVAGRSRLANCPPSALTALPRSA